MAYGDRVQVKKWESPALGGTETDEYARPINAQEDFLEAAGFYFQDSSNRDKLVYASRSGNDLQFKDVTNTLQTLADMADDGLLRHLLISDDTHCAEGMNDTYRLKKTFRHIMDSDRPPSAYVVIATLWVEDGAITGTLKVDINGDYVELTSTAGAESQAAALKKGTITVTNQDYDEFINVNVYLKGSAGFPSTAHHKYLDIYSVH